MTRPELIAAIRAACPSASRTEVLALTELVASQAHAIARTPRHQMDDQRRAQPA